MPYRLDWYDRIFNYIVGCRELGLDTTPVVEHFTEHLGEETTRNLLSRVEQELSSPLFFFEAIYCITPATGDGNREKIYNRFKALAIEAGVRFFQVISVPGDDQASRALSHRAIIVEAQQHELGNVLVVEDEVSFLDRAEEILEKCIKELEHQDWDLFYLGADQGEQTHQVSNSGTHLRQPLGLVDACAVTCSRQILNELLDTLPATPDEASVWLGEHRDIDHYYCRIGKRFVSRAPIVARVAQ